MTDGAIEAPEITADRSAQRLGLLIPSFPAQLGLCLWLIVFGVNGTRWKAVLLANTT